MSSAFPIGSPQGGLQPQGGVQVRFWAGAKSAAGRSELVVAPGSAQEILAHLRAELGEPFHKIAAGSSLLLDGVVLHDLEHHLSPGSTLEVLPPFAGG
jgi:molybdopterin synthase sulfur carrier subunit